MNTKDIQKLISQWRDQSNEGSRSMEEVVINIIDHIWKLHQSIQGQRGLYGAHHHMMLGIIGRLDKQQQTIDAIRQDIEQLKRTDDAHIEPVSTENPQETPQSAHHCIECCGNCLHLGDENADGQGLCSDALGETKLRYCGDWCTSWEHKPLCDGNPVMWKTCDNRNEVWKLGYYCSKIPFGHSVRTRRDGGTIHNVQIVKPFDTFNPSRI